VGTKVDVCQQTRHTCTTYTRYIQLRNAIHTHSGAATERGDMETPGAAKEEGGWQVTIWNNSKEEQVDVQPGGTRGETPTGRHIMGGQLTSGWEEQTRKKPGRTE
jgi:hypothetical protein